MIEPTHDGELLVRFNRLIRELLRGTMTRNTFRPWEIQLLLDIESCGLRKSSRRDILLRYQKAVQRQMENGARFPMKLSEYLETTRGRRRANGRSSSGVHSRVSS